jgi:hypothetical protein
VAYASQSWLLNCRLTVTCAVPDDSLIFDLCRTGQTSAVEVLLAKNMAGVVDTSPDGWKPLHVRNLILDFVWPRSYWVSSSLLLPQDMSTYARCSSEQGQTSPLWSIKDLQRLSCKLSTAGSIHELTPSGLLSHSLSRVRLACMLRRR